MFNRLRFLFASLTKLSSYSSSFINLLHDRYLGHHKIIHWRKGCPVYSLSIPAFFSSAYANLANNLIFRILQNKPLPNLASIALTDVCNAKCEHCSFFGSLNDNCQQVLSPQQMVDLIKQTQDLGVAMINFVGGEPLLYPHLYRVLENVDHNRSQVTIFTNGYFLKEEAAKLAKAGVEGIYVSIDSAIAKVHDKKRGINGLFDKAIAGIKEAKKTKLSLGISCCVDEKAFRDGSLDKIIELAKNLKIHEVVIFDAKPVGQLCDHRELYGQQKWITEMIAHVKKYNEDKTYPSVLAYAYASSFLSVGCSGGTNYFYISPYGEMCPCDFYHEKYGNVKNQPLALIWEKMQKSLAPSGVSYAGCHAKNKSCKDCEKKTIIKKAKTNRKK